MDGSVTGACYRVSAIQVSHTADTPLTTMAIRGTAAILDLFLSRRQDDNRGSEHEMKLRLLAAAGVLVSAGVHLYLWFHVFRHAHVVGPAFMVNAVGGVIIAVLLMTWEHWIPLVLAVGFGVATLGAFIIAATAGLYGVHEHWTTWEVWTAAAAEVVAILAAGTLLLHQIPRRADHRLQQPVSSH